MNIENETKTPKITIDGSTATDAALERIRAIDKRVTEIKAERTALNREKHMLSRWLAS
jgi:uncharacterized protein YegL